MQIQDSIMVLMSNLNETEQDLSLAHDEIAHKESLDDLRTQIKDGRLNVNYETGEIAGGKFNTTSEEMALEMSKLQLESDPAILHLDVDLLQDIVLLSIATALGGTVSLFMLACLTS